MNGAYFLSEGIKSAKAGLPVTPGKSAGAAFAAGFLFGPIGCGAYLESWHDFFVPLAWVLAATFLSGGVAAPVAWMFCGLYAAARVNAAASE